MENTLQENSHLPDEVDGVLNDDIFEDWEDEKLNLNSDILRGFKLPKFPFKNTTEWRKMFQSSRKSNLVCY